MATIRNRLEPADGGTRVSAETELHITGPQAQFGRGVIEDVGSRVLSEFSQRLEQKIAGSGEAESASAAGPAAPQPPVAAEQAPGAEQAPAAQPPAPRAADELDVGSLVASTPAVRIGAAALLLALVLILLRRRR